MYTSKKKADEPELLRDESEEEWVEGKSKISLKANLLDSEGEKKCHIL